MSRARSTIIVVLALGLALSPRSGAAPQSSGPPTLDQFLGAGFHPTGWRSGSTDSNIPSITITATANGEG